MKGSESATTTSTAQSRASRWICHPIVPRILRAYFYSGWAFLIPYLAAYLLYAWLKWPVNSAREDTSTPAVSGIPSLLYVYWFLHVVHLALASIALTSWWRRPRLRTAGSADSLHESVASRLYRLVPWALLALIFAIPGIYLEWPSDPWEHLRRINEWHACGTVTAHSAWSKTSYFLPYSLTEHLTGLPQLRWLNVYYVGICLLLSWQYYRLGRAVGLSTQLALAFVVLNALTFGNNTFSFYRYYGLSSSVFAQISAVSLIRVALVATADLRPSWADIRSRVLPAAVPTLVLVLFTAFNHIQGIGIAALGVFGILGWRLVAWRRALVWWIIVVLVALSFATFLWYPRDPTLFEYYKTHGWMNSILGLDIFDPASPAFDRTVQILGAFGLMNVAAAIWLVLRNNVVGWLTLAPLILLALPCLGLPLGQIIGERSGGHDIVVFQRLLFAVPSGLAVLIAACEAYTTSPPTPKQMCRRGSVFQHSNFPISRRPQRLPMLLSLSLAVGLLGFGVSSLFPTYDRIWHSMYVLPADLSFRPVIAAGSMMPRDSNYRIGSTPAITWALSSMGDHRGLNAQRIIGSNIPHHAPAFWAAKVVAELEIHRNSPGARFHLPVESPGAFTAGSQAARASQHWLAYEVALSRVGLPEIAATGALILGTPRSRGGP